MCKGLMHAWVGTRRWCDREELAGSAALVFSLIMRIFYLGLRATTWRASASMARLTGVKNDGNNNGAHSRRHLPHQSVECCDLAECLIQGGHAALPAGVGKEVGGMSKTSWRKRKISVSHSHTYTHTSRSCMLPRTGARIMSQA